MQIMPLRATRVSRAWRDSTQARAKPAGGAGPCPASAASTKKPRRWPGLLVATGLTGSIRSSCRRRLRPARRPGRPRRGVRRSWSAPARPAVP
ncbi:MAG: hypothetical protein DI592_09250 [Stenotrophomonas maltophilia]|nr:MAG: hypothetical protein DI592_09250 [Stenotrophomonas maltophilia]